MILDTNALSAFADADPHAVTKIGRASLIAIPVVVLGEFLFGVTLSRRRTEYEEWMRKILESSRTLEVGADTARKYAEVRSELKQAGTPIPANDAWIAALCRQYALPVMSRDRHFDYVRGIRRVSW